MADFDFKVIEEKWQDWWDKSNLFEVSNESNKPKYYVLDMFPYPSGAGLHVGHPLGYIATDIVSRYKRNKGFNVLHPMGFDAFGLPAEQYAIQTGQHPAVTTEKNIKRYKSQLRNMGFCFDWSREVITSDPKFYKWTQWIFIRLFNSWYNNNSQKAEPLDSLIEILSKSGNKEVDAACDEETKTISSDEWNSYNESEKENFLNHYRLTYPAEAMVNWCPELGTVLANDEVKDGFSERGGYPVERKKMKQWMMRITAYAERLLQNLNELDWSTALKDIQSNWIGKSKGCELKFKIEGSERVMTAFTTRPDTAFGVTFMVIAPELEWIEEICSEEQKEEVKSYIEKSVNRSERERQTEVKQVSGVFTGAFAINPYNQEKIPIYTADYVLAGYGTGVIMAVPAGDDRDFRFAQHFNLPVIPIIKGTENLEDPTVQKNGVMINSGFLNGLKTEKAIEKAIQYAEDHNFGNAKINYKIRDAVFSRQRYWGEPVPIYFNEGIPHTLEEKELPLLLPEVDEYKPTSTGEPPLARAKNWRYQGKYNYELTTMPGWAGSSWYFLRYMDPQNENSFVSRKASDYWGEVDLYIGGTEHATGHLLYSRFWNMFLFDSGLISHEEPFKKLVNQGMIQGRSSIAYRLKEKDAFVSAGLKSEHDTIPVHVDVNLVENDILDIETFKNQNSDYSNTEFVLEGGQFKCDYAIEKMSKRWFNVVNPDDVITKYGADTLRMYEMFLGPLEDSKPWDTQGIDGVYKFLRKTWRLFYDDNGQNIITDEKASPEALKVLHQTIKKVEEDIERFSFNTSVSAFMICVNELGKLKTHNKEILEPLCIILSPFAPHLCEELWHALGNKPSVVDANWPAYKEEFLKESSFEYPIMINGKLRTKITFALDSSKEEIQREVLKDQTVIKWAEGKAPKKVIIVPGKIVNLVY
ncbi:leucine--tRNA ligase [Hyphobacterium sp. CCMP332]|nr:leucine--tRNA ligase [Hyphobacterium sp. CCMP332]